MAYRGVCAEIFLKSGRNRDGSCPIKIPKRLHPLSEIPMIDVQNETLIPVLAGAAASAHEYPHDPTMGRIRPA